VDGVGGPAWTHAGRVLDAVEFTTAVDRIVQIDPIGDPEHLDRLDVVLLEDLTRSHRRLLVRHSEC
jgi:hypothetical protein